MADGGPARPRPRVKRRAKPAKGDGGNLPSGLTDGANTRRRTRKKSTAAAATAAAGKRPPKSPEELARRKRLRTDGQETLRLMEFVAVSMPGFNPKHSETIRPYVLPMRNPTTRRAMDSVRIRVISEDSFTAAINLYGQRGGRVAVLNMANEKTPGGGFLNGALAQEELLCYRSSLYLALREQLYPWNIQTCLYTPDVVIIRDRWRGMKSPSSHKILHGLNSYSSRDLKEYNPRAKKVVQKGVTVNIPDKYRVSVLSFAAVRLKPSDITIVNGRKRYVDSNVATQMKQKMRLTFRTAVEKGHKMVVLGASGCGAFNHPAKVVAQLWKEVLREQEFLDWDGIVVFAVLDSTKRSDNNYQTFKKALDGKSLDGKD